MLPEFLRGLGSDGDHAGEPTEPRGDELCRQGACEEDAIEVSPPAGIHELPDPVLADSGTQGVDAVAGVARRCAPRRIALLLSRKAGDCDLHYRFIAL